VKKWIILSLFVQLSSYGANQDMDKIVTLAEDTRDATVELKFPDNSVLPKSQEDAKYVYALKAHDEEMDSLMHAGQVGQEISIDQIVPCSDDFSLSSEVAGRIQGRKFQIGYEMILSDAADKGAPEGGRSQMFNYRSFMRASAFDDGKTAALQIQNIGSLENRYKQANPDVEWDTLTRLERAQRLEGFATQFSGASPSLGLILSEYAITDMTNNPGNWQESLNEIKDHLSFNEKIQLVSHFGGRFSNNYNYDRAAGNGARADGVVTIEEMLTSVQTSTPGGVCRDVTNAQSQMLMELGVAENHIFQTAYSTEGEGHVVMAVRDPNDPNRIMRINYSYTDEVDDRSGGAALTQNSSLPDFGQNFRIYDAHGKPVGRVPTEFGEVLRDVTRSRKLSDGLSRNFSMNKVYVDTPLGIGSIYNAQTVSGDKIVGVAFRNAQTQQAGLNYGITLTRREGNRSSVDISQNAVYGYFNYEARTPRIKANENLSSGATVTPYADFMYMQNSVTRSNGRYTTEGINLEATSGVLLRADADYRSPSGRTHLTTGIEADVYADVQNEQEGPSGGLRPAIDSLTLDATVEHELTEDIDMIGEAAFVNRFSGTTFIGRGTLNYNDTTQFSLGYQKPLGDNIGFDTLSTENVEVRASRSFLTPSDRVSGDMYVTYTKDLTFDNNTFGAGFGIKW